VPLAQIADGVERGLASMTDRRLIPEPDGVRAIWRDALAAPGWTGPPLWLHGDLHPANVVTDHGRL
jgi:aminoglycoside phosphotransferase (APT) family kinase protein